MYCLSVWWKTAAGYTTKLLNHGLLPLSLHCFSQHRMPSGMLGSKDKVNPTTKTIGGEGGLRNHLAVTGPGVPSGTVDSTLLSLSDVLPTVAELAGLSSHQSSPTGVKFIGNFTVLSQQWSGKSFINLLVPGGKATQQQQERYHFTLVTCPATDYLLQKLPALGIDRSVGHARHAQSNNGCY
jgi:arylsulfatase A-like enzyme